LATLQNAVDRQAAKILSDVRMLLNQRAMASYQPKVYVFGSVLRGDSEWADVDLLVVAATPAECDALQKALEPICSTVPLHLTVVLHSEFEELGCNAWGEIHELECSGSPRYQLRARYAPGTSGPQ
jgi:predicted nucleotidyltransferase